MGSPGRAAGARAAHTDHCDHSGAAPVVAANYGGGEGGEKTTEYREHAEECRTLAAQMKGEQREHLLDMARTWDKLAEERSDLIRRHPELGLSGEYREEVHLTEKK